VAVTEYGPIYVVNTVRAKQYTYIKKPVCNNGASNYPVCGLQDNTTDPPIVPDVPNTGYGKNR
jgi:hypothetical protein